MIPRVFLHGILMAVDAPTEALSNFGFQYLTKVYLPSKLAELDAVPAS